MSASPAPAESSGASTALDAQRRADDIHAFYRELARLRAEDVAPDAGWLTTVRHHHEPLLAALSQRWDVDAGDQARQLSLGMRIVSFIGAVALAAAVFLLFAQFWGLLATLWQVVILLVAPLLALALCFAVQPRDSSGYFTKLAALLALACFVLNVTLLGRLYNLPASEWSLLVWAALALLLAYACRGRLLLVAALVCVAVFIPARVGAFSGAYWLNLGDRPENFFLPALLFLLLPWRISQRRYPGFATSYRVAGLLCLFLPILLLAHWSWGSYLPGSPGQIERFYQLAAFVASATAIGAGLRLDLPDVTYTSLVFFVIYLGTCFFDWWWDVMPNYLFFLLIALSAFLLLLVFMRLRRRLMPELAA